MRGARRQQRPGISVAVDADADRHAVLGAEAHVGRGVADGGGVPSGVVGVGGDAVVVGAALGAVGLGAEDDLEGVPALLLEHALGALGRGARGEHQRGAAGGELAQDGVGVRVGDGRDGVVELVEHAQEAGGGAVGHAAVQAHRLEDLARRAARERVEDLGQHLLRQRVLARDRAERGADGVRVHERVVEVEDDVHRPG